MRVRLTKRMRKAEDMQTINQERKFVEHGDYDMTTETVNHPLPDLRKDWKEDPKKRNEAHLVTAKRKKNASIWRVAAKATRLATTFLGEDASQEAIEDQALAFASLGEDVLDESIERYNDVAETASEDEVEAEDEVEVETASEDEVETASEDEVEAEDEVETETASEDEVETASEDEVEAEDEVETETASEDEVEEDEDEDEDYITAGEAEFDVLDPLDDALTAEDEDEDVDDELVGLFDDKSDVVASKRTAKKKVASKKGIQTLAQPRVATASRSDMSLDGIWKSEPDMTSFFK